MLTYSIPKHCTHTSRWLSKSFDCFAKSDSARVFYSTQHQSISYAEEQQRKQHRQLNKNPPSSTSQPENTVNVRHQDYYNLFPQTLPKGPPPAGPFSINTRQLRSEFLQLQAKAHPDRFSSLSSASSSSPSHNLTEKRKAEALSAHINAAYKTLQDPLLRAQYLLSLRSGDNIEGYADRADTNSAGKSSESSPVGDPSSDETAKTEDPELLMTVMETREVIENAEKEEDLAEVKEENDERMKRSVNELEKAFEKDDLQRASQEAVRLKYWTGVNEGIRGWEVGKGARMDH